MAATVAAAAVASTAAAVADTLLAVDLQAATLQVALWAAAHLAAPEASPTKCGHIASASQVSTQSQSIEGGGCQSYLLFIYVLFIVYLLSRPFERTTKTLAVLNLLLLSQSFSINLYLITTQSHSTAHTFSIPPTHHHQLPNTHHHHFSPLPGKEEGERVPKVQRKRAAAEALLLLLLNHKSQRLNICSASQQKLVVVLLLFTALYFKRFHTTRNMPGRNSLQSSKLRVGTSKRSRSTSSTPQNTRQNTKRVKKSQRRANKSAPCTS